MYYFYITIVNENIISRTINDLYVIDRNMLIKMNILGYHMIHESVAHNFNGFNIYTVYFLRNDSFAKYGK